MKVTLQIQKSKVLTVEELIIVLQKCPPNSRVYFNNSVVETDDRGDYIRLEGVEFVESRQDLTHSFDANFPDAWVEIKLYKCKPTRKISKHKVNSKNNNFAQTP